MNYTLFVDESGDFESFKGEWVIGSILFEGSKETVNDKLSNLSKLLKSSGAPFLLNEYHLTEFRQNLGNSEAIHIADNLFCLLSKAKLRFKFLTVINEHKVGLSQRERTYRTMLRDLLSIIDCSIPVGEKIENLDLVVATRTIDGDIQTSFADICSDILGYIPKETEYDLASLGIVDLINKNKLSVELMQANKSWGLVCADFISNLSYHRNKKDSQTLLDKLYVSAKLQTFNGIGGYKVRRAKIAAANGDYQLSCERWISIAIDNTNDEAMYSNFLKEISILIQLIINEGGTSFGIYSILSLEESLWRAFHDYERRIAALEVLERAMTNLDKEYVIKMTLPLFKLRNLLLLSFNHIGNTEKALKLVKYQEVCCEQNAFDPDFFSLLLDYKRIQSEIYVNLLDFEKAFLYVSEYHQLVDNYSQVLSLISNDENNNFRKSSVWIKCESNYLRIVSLVGLKNSGESVESYRTKINRLRENKLSSTELSRLDNMWLVVLLKSGKIRSALEFQQSRKLSIENSSVFDIYHELLSYYFYVITGGQLENTFVDRVIKIVHRLNVDSLINEKQHPVASIYLLLSLIAWKQNNTKDAKKFISKAKKCFNLNRSSKIASAIFNCISIADSVIFSKGISQDIYSEGFITKSDNLDKLDLLNKYIELTTGL